MSKSLLFCILALVLVACAAPTPMPTATSTPPSVKVWLRCQECADIGMEINLWKTPSRQGVAGSVPHNTQVYVLETKSYEGFSTTRYGPTM